MFLNFNGEVHEEGVALLRADNRGFRYGDGLFETMLVRQGKVRLGGYHLDRLTGGMRLLRLEFPRQESKQPFCLDMLEGQIAELCGRNGHGALVRARLTVFRRSGGLYNGPERKADYILQTGTVGEGLGWQEEGLTLGVFPDGRKACDAYSGIKSNNYQLSTQAGMFARERSWDDCLLLNSYGRVAETAVANIWWVKGGLIYTPPLSEGCVAGVMRRLLLEALPAAGYTVREEPVAPAGLAGAEEVFSSNAIRGVQWVRNLEGAEYGCRVAAAIRDEIIQKI
jgi:branched-chain amino acid aminotransferase